MAVRKLVRAAVSACVLTGVAGAGADSRAGAQEVPVVAAPLLVARTPEPAAERSGLVLQPSAPPAGEAVAAITEFAAALELTARSNPAYLAERAQVRASLYRIDQAQAAFGFSASAQGSYGYARDRFDTPSGIAQTFSGFSATATAILRQPLYTSGRLSGTLKAAQAEGEYRKQVRRYAESQALLAATSAYVGVLRDRAFLQIAQRNLELLGSQLGDSQRRFEVREITAVDLDQVASRSSASEADYESARAIERIAEANFIRTIGAPAGTLEQVPPPIGLMPASLEQALQVAELQSPLLLAAQARERISRAQIRVATSDLGPNVALQGSATYGPNSPYSNQLNQSELRAGVTVTMPLYESGARIARIREAEAVNDADLRLVDQGLRDLRADVEANWDRYAAGLKTLEKLRVAAAKAADAYNGAVIQERSGLVTTLDVLILLRDLLGFRSQLVSAEAETQVARYGVLAAIGRLEADIVLPDLQLRRAEPGTRRVTDALALPLGPLVGIADAFLAPDYRKPPVYRDEAAATRPAGLVLPAQGNEQAVTVGQDLP